MLRDFDNYFELNNVENVLYNLLSPSQTLVAEFPFPPPRHTAAGSSQIQDTLLTPEWSLPTLSPPQRRRTHLTPRFRPMRSFFCFISPVLLGRAGYSSLLLLTHQVTFFKFTPTLDKVTKGK